MAQVTKGRTFVSGETVTPAKLNELVDNATITFTTASDADDSTLEVSGNKFRVKDAGIVTAKLSDANVTTAKLANASVTPTKLSQPLTFMTAQASTSGTSIDFTVIPSWARRITVMFSEVSTNGTNDVLVQLGDAGGIENTGYVSTSNAYSTSNTTAGVSRTDGFAVYYTNAVHLLTGHMTITKIDGNSWVSSHSVKYLTTHVASGGGSKTLTDTLTQVRITTVGGTNTFDAGTINVSYE